MPLVWRRWTTALELHLPVSGVIDLFARTVATRYLQGDYSYERADMAMNQLYGFAYMANDLGFSEFAWEVFYAFDEGEYVHADPESTHGEELTRELLNKISSLREQHGS